MRTMAVAIAFLLAGPARAAVVDLAAMELLPQETGRFQVRVACAAGSSSQACRELQGLAPSLTFRTLDVPSGVDAGDREALRSAPAPLTAVLGEPISLQAAGRIAGTEVCGRRIFESGAVDQYGGTWTLTPYMYLAGQSWVHRWTVVPRFAGYETSVLNGRVTAAILLTQEEVARRRGPRRDFLDKFRSLNPFSDAARPAR